MNKGKLLSDKIATEFFNINNWRLGNDSFYYYEINENKQDVIDLVKSKFLLGEVIGYSTDEILESNSFVDYYFLWCSDITSDPANYNPKIKLSLLEYNIINFTHYLYKGLDLSSIDKSHINLSWYLKHPYFNLNYLSPTYKERYNKFISTEQAKEDKLKQDYINSIKPNSSHLAQVEKSTISQRIL